MELLQYTCAHYIFGKKKRPAENTMKSCHLYVRTTYCGIKLMVFFSKTIKNGASGTRADGFRTEIVVFFFHPS